MAPKKAAKENKPKVTKAKEMKPKRKDPKDTKEGEKPKDPADTQGEEKWQEPEYTTGGEQGSDPNDTKQERKRTATVKVEPTGAAKETLAPIPPAENRKMLGRLSYMAAKGDEGPLKEYRGKATEGLQMKHQTQENHRTQHLEFQILSHPRKPIMYIHLYRRHGLVNVFM
jgi:hypothetical protein